MKQTHTERAYETLESEIVSGKLPPGTRLIEDSVANRLGLSRTPVREAFKMLERAGWIEIQPRAGTIVRVPRLDELGEALVLRNLLENEVARLATRRVTDADVEDLRRIIAEGRAALAVADPVILAELNREFHQRLLTIAGNSLLGRFLNTIYEQVRWYFAGVVIEKPEEAWDQHERIVETVAARDSEQAIEAMRAHAQRTRKTYMEALLGESISS